MRVVVRLHGFADRERALELAAGATVADALRALAIRRDLVLVFRGNSPVPDTDDLVDGDALRVVRVVSGGKGTYFRQDAASAPASARAQAADVG
ncbi:MAG TPA: MoaD/ThiS family protein [Candidatus Thermoplasmatota archaeon]|nr:MoaD/ThiS family protein [Candidatus Thermoplasmatota archaeon]